MQTEQPRTPSSAFASATLRSLGTITQPEGYHAASWQVVGIGRGSEGGRPDGSDEFRNAGLGCLGLARKGIRVVHETSRPWHSQIVLRRRGFAHVVTCKIGEPQSNPWIDRGPRQQQTAASLAPIEIWAAHARRFQL